MIRYTAVFAALHLTCSALLGYFTGWLEAHGRIVGGGSEVLSIFAGVQAASAYFVRREKRLPIRSESWAFLLQSCFYLFLVNTLIIWFVLPRFPALTPTDHLVAVTFAIVATLLGFWASKPAAQASMQKYIERGSRGVA